MQKELHTILNAVPVISIHGSTDALISQIQTDSRVIQAQGLFVACKGVAVDGHAFISAAIDKGAVAIVCEHLPREIHPSVCYVVVENSIAVCGSLLTNLYEIDFSKLSVIGVTGTNGKTTTVTLLYKVFTQLGFSCGLLSTVRNVIGTQEFEASHTTPDIVQLYKFFYAMQQNSCSYCFMEVSSHAIHQQRVAGVPFAGAVFTNITQDHLDYHETFAEYIRVKKQFFDTLPKSAFALVNSDDKHGTVMLQNTRAKSYTYALRSFADYSAKIIEMHTDGMLLSVQKTEVWTKFLGAFNGYNILAVYAVATLCGCAHDSVLQVLSSLSPADGRLEFFKNAEGKTAIVDYAHTPDALENILSTLQTQCKGDMQIITVVGAGGNRDKTKRPLMGNIAAKMSAKVIITSDNPRNENPQDIANDMIAGISPEDSHKVLCILQREEAIKTALMLAKHNDLVVVAGKGHETYQEIEGVKHHFDDREVIKNIFKL